MFIRPKPARGLSATPRTTLRRLHARLTLAPVLVLALTTGVVAQGLAPPTFGRLEVGPSLGATIETLAIEAGGSDPASGLGADCLGSLNAAAPDVIVDLTAPVARLSLFATAGADTTIAVRRPSGAVLCNDDADGVDPAVTLLKPSAGAYEVWLGTISAAPAQAQLHISLGEPDWGAVRTPARLAPTGADLPEGPARYLALATADLPLATPREIEIVAGGPDPVAAYDSRCGGFIEVGMPDVTIAADPGFGTLSLRVRSSADTTLVARLPDGTLRCNDDAFGVDPALEITDLPPGPLAIWVGMFDASIADARLEITRSLSPATFSQRPTPQALTLAPTPDAEAARIAQGLIAGLEGVLTGLDPLGQADLRLTTDAPVTVARDGARFALDLPGLALAVGDLTLRLGDPRIEVAAGAGPNRAWRATLPPVIEVFEGRTPLGALVWSEGHLEGVTEATTGYALNTDLQLANLGWRPRDPGQTTGFEVGSLRLGGTLRPTGGGLYTGQGGLELGDLAISDSDGALRIGQIVLRNSVTDTDPAMAEQLRAVMTALAEGTPAAEALRPILQAPWGSSDSLLELRDLAFDTPQGEGLRLARLHIGSGLDARADLGTLGLSWSLEGMRANHPDWPEGLDTADAALAIRLGRLPLRQLLGLAAAIDPTDQDALGLLGLQALGALIAAGPELEIATMTLAGGPARLQGQGAFRMAGGLAGEGEMDIVLDGMPEMIAMVSDGQIGGAEAQDLLPGLLLLRGLGQPNPNGPEGSLRYRVELRPDMTLTVNGVDLQGMLR